MSALDHPTMLAQPIVALDATSGDSVFDATPPEMVAASRIVVALVSVQFVGPAQRSAANASDGRHGIDQLLEDHRVVPVCPGDAEHQRDALPVGDEVAFAAELAAVRRVGARVRAPRGLGTVDPSTLTRLRSSWPALRSCASSIRCRRCHTPAACQSRRRRQQVMPLPKPSSCGRSSQAMPVRRTKRMPLSANSSSSRGRPPLPDGLACGSNGSTVFHSFALTSLLLVMHCQT